VADNSSDLQVPRHVFVEVSNIKFLGNASSESGADIYINGWTDGQGDGHEDGK